MMRWLPTTLITCTFLLSQSAACGVPAERQGIPIPRHGIETGSFVSTLAAAAVALQNAPQNRQFLAPAGRKNNSFISVDAVKVAEGSHVIFYSEEANSMVMEIAGSIVEYIDRVVFPEENRLFGPILDTGKNGKLIFLATSVVNHFSHDPGQITGGFFASNDQTQNHGSNHADLLYLYLPKPKEQGGVYDRAEEYRALLNEVIVHELQHMINYKAHRENGGSTESVWLNEGLSHWAEEHFGYFRSNSIRGQKFLESPETTSLLGGADTLAQRGAAFLFVKYLVDKSDDPMILRKLVCTNRVSIANIEYAVGRSFGAVVRDWSEALYVDGESSLPGFRRHPAEGIKDNLRATFPGMPQPHQTASAHRRAVLGFIPEVGIREPVGR